MTRKNERIAILGRQIRNPLIFFALALLLIEGIIGMVITKANLIETHTFYSVCIMALLFVIVVGVMTLITIKWPRHLYEDIVEEIEITHAIKEYLESPAFKDTVEDIIYKNIKEECIIDNDSESLKGGYSDG